MIESSESQAAFTERLKSMPRGIHTGLTEQENAEPQPIRVSLNEARKQWAAAGYKLVDKTEYKRRYAICKPCDSLVCGRCKECNCFMRLKSLLAGMTCRLNKW